MVIVMSNTTTGKGDGLFDELKSEMNSFLEKGLGIIESEQSKITKALFDTLEPAQRDIFCKSLSKQNVKPARLQKITGKSQSTVNRHLNGKNS